MSENKKEIGKKCYQLYLQSVENLKGTSPDLADEVIVALWLTVDSLTKQNNKLKSENEELGKSNREYYKQVDILSSREVLLQRIMEQHQQIIKDANGQI